MKDMKIMGLALFARRFPFPNLQVNQWTLASLALAPYIKIGS